MRVEIDMSGKIEQKEFDTRIAATRGKESSICIISKGLKRDFLSLRNVKMHKKEKVLKMFCSGIALAVLPILKSDDELWIDREYTGQSEAIKKALLSLISVHGFKNVRAYFVTHKDVTNAHNITRNPMKADYLIRVSEKNKRKIFDLIFKK
jgi:hypothetical protein